MRNDIYEESSVKYARATYILLESIYHDSIKRAKELNMMVEKLKKTIEENEEKINHLFEKGEWICAYCDEMIKLEERYYEFNGIKIHDKCAREMALIILRNETAYAKSKLDYRTRLR